MGMPSHNGRILRLLIGCALAAAPCARAALPLEVYGRLHRIDEAFARADFEKHGFEFVATSDVLRRPDDARDQLSYKPPALGKTDRFVMVFHKR